MQDPDLVRLRESAIRRCLAAGASRQDAEDCAQEALLVLLSETEKTRPRSAAAWVSTVAYRRYVDLLRRRGREQVAVIRLGDENDRTLPGVDEVVTDRALARWLVDGLSGLPSTTSEVCVATGLGADTQAVAQRLNLTRRSVESHLTRARRWLRSASAATILPPSLLVAIRRLFESGTPATVAVGMVTAVMTLVVPLPEGKLTDPGQLSRSPQPAIGDSPHPPAPVTGGTPSPATGPVQPSPSAVPTPPQGPVPGNPPLINPSLSVGPVLPSLIPPAVPPLRPPVDPDLPPPLPLPSPLPSLSDVDSLLPGLGAKLSPEPAVDSRETSEVLSGAG